MEDIKIFPRTKTQITARLEDVIELLNRNRLALGSLEYDGDMMDDPQMHALHNERERLEGEKAYLEMIINATLVDRAEVESQISVSLGHAVTIRLVYADGEKETIIATIATVADAKYLAGSFRSNGHNTMIISEDTPLASAVLGRSTGESIEYSTPSGIATAKILSIEVSNKLFAES